MQIWPMTFTDDTGQQDDTQKVVWKSDNSDVLEVDPDTGKITGVSKGSAIVTVSTTYQDITITDTIKITVEKPPSPDTTQKEAYVFVLDPPAGPLHLVEDDKYALSYSFGTE